MEYRTCLENVISLEGYSRICNKLALDSDLSLKAKGIFLMIVSLSTIPEWDFSVEGLILLTREGESAIRSAIRELKKGNYLRVERIQQDGKITKFVYKLNNSNGEDFSSKDYLDKIKGQNGRCVDLYLMQNKETKDLKIGISIEPEKRRLDLQNSSGREIEILYVIPRKSNLESFLHEKFSHLRLLGEWFKYDESIVEEFERLANN